jgi:hypothetical protein
MESEMDSGTSFVGNKSIISAIKYLLNLKFEEIIQNLDIKCIINDNFAVCVRIRPKDNFSIVIKKAMHEKW